MEGIEVYTTDQLFLELKRRFPRGALFAGLREPPGDAAEAEDWEQEFYVAYSTLVPAVGLAAFSKKLMLKRLAKDATKHRSPDDGESKE